MKKYTLFFTLIFSIIFIQTCDKPSEANNSNTEEAYLQRGKSIAAATFATLSGNLQKAMQKGGVKNAIKYCNLAAMPLVDSLSSVHQANIRRTSLKVRNPKNTATAIELKQLRAYQKALDNEEKIHPVLQHIDSNTIAFYAPINTMPLCQKCHGSLGDKLLAEDYEEILKFYPKDQAIGYRNGSWRGMWSISFRK